MYISDYCAILKIFPEVGSGMVPVDKNKYRAYFKAGKQTRLIHMDTFSELR